MRSVVIFSACAVAAAIIIPHFAGQMHSARPSPTVMSAEPGWPGSPAGVNSRSVTVSRDWRGRFRIDGRIDGRRLEFTVDTGASVVALKADDAASLGIHPAARDFRALVATANGTVRAASIELDMVEIDDLVVRNVAAMVLPDGALSENLLGMSFLTRLRHFEYTDGKLVLEQ